MRTATAAAAGGDRGAGSGKINTLAHRVAHLIVRCAEPELLAGIEYRAELAESKSVFQGIKEGL